MIKSKALQTITSAFLAAPCITGNWSGLLANAIAAMEEDAVEAIP